MHAFDSTRRLVLGGVTIDGAPGLAGWSDADVLCHSVMDALLGAAGLGDLGSHFPEDRVNEGVSSLELLRRTQQLVDDAGFRIVNVDCLVAIQDVRILPHRENIQSRMSEALRIDASMINVKATSTDRLGFVGRLEGAASMAVALVE